ncbi:MAG: DUF1294 domain-containing protein [Candidatus Promineifilaceae bacterium]
MNRTVLLITLGIYAVMSFFAFFAVMRDKRIAQRNARRLKAISRIPERTLHTLEFLGGVLGSLLAQQVFRHKTQQRAYQNIFWMIFAAHIIGWIIYLAVMYLQSRPATSAVFGLLM